MKKIFVLLLFLSTTALYGQTVAEVMRDKDQYVYEIGYGDTLEEADRNAMTALSNHSAMVSHSASHSTEDIISGNQASSTSQYKDNTSIISSMYLPEVGRHILQDENGKKRVMRFATMSDWEHRYDLCKSKIQEYVVSAMYAEEDFVIDEALRNYSWAYVLLMSYPGEPIVIDGVTGGLSQHCMSSIRRILSGIDIKVVNVNEVGKGTNQLYPYTLDLDVMYKGEPVEYLTFSYFDGSEFVDGATAKDGRTMVEMRRLPKNFTVDVECVYKDLALSLEPNIYTILQAPGINVKFEGEMIDVAINYSPEAVSSENVTTNAFAITAEAIQSAVDNKLKEAVTTHVTVKSEITDYSKYETVMADVTKGIRNANMQSLRDHFTEEGWEDFSMIVASGNPVIIREPDFRFLQLDTLLLCRSIPVKLKFSGNRSFVEDVTFRFNLNTNKIQSVAYALSSSAETRIMAMDWEDKGRLTLINFLEDYRTAYCLKDINYIEKVFSADAYIIVGKLVKTPEKKSTDAIALNLPQETVQYQTKTKKEYISDLRQSFRSKEFVNIRFDECEPAKGYGPKEGIYAVQVKQHYFSNNYADDGYLTLAIDMRDGNNPLVKVRVWQKYRNEEYTAETMIDKTVSTGQGIY